MKRIAIYGAGAFGKIFYQALNHNIDFFIDDFTMDTNIFNIPIKRLEDVDKDTLIYISVLQHSKKIELQLKENGFTNIMNFSKSIKTIPNILEEISRTNYLWLTEDRSKMFDEKLYVLKKLLKDQKSKNLLEKIIMLRKTLDAKYYIDSYDKEYFPSDVPILQNLSKINFIDCGAYTGDSVRDMMLQNKDVKLCVSFEPDIKNLEKLNAECKHLKTLYPQTDFLIYPAGVYSLNTTLKFSNNGVDSSASLSDSSDTLISVVSLDSVILNANPNYIKMDIEGAEKEAIIGATQTIQKYKPNLAICLYHKPEDLWEIPLLINEIEPAYDMYLRVHEDMCLSTVLYCISKEKDV